jgi:outer membrane protein assembly factor BamB
MKQIILLPLLLFSLTALAAPGAPGTVKWSLNTEEPPVGDMVAGPSSTLYLTSTNASIAQHLWSINMLTGQKNWAYEIAGTQSWEPAVDPTSGDIAVTSDDGPTGSGTLFYVSPLGTLLWQSSFSNIKSMCSGYMGWPGKPAITNDGDIYVPFMNVCTDWPQQNVDSNVALYNKSGAALSYDLHDDGGTTPIFGNVRPYAYSWLYNNRCFTTDHGNIASCSVAMGVGSDATGGNTTSGSNGDSFTGSTAVDGGDHSGNECEDAPTARCTSTVSVNNTSTWDTFYIGETDGLATPDGKGSVTTSTDMTYARPVFNASGELYDGGINGYLYVINPDGTYKHEYLVNSSGIYHRVALDPDGTIYVTTGNGSIMAIDGPTGTIKWQMAINAKTAPLVGPDGTVYVDTTAGVVYAFNGEPRTKK